MDQALKQRLVGATILIALAVIFLPMLLDGENHDGQATRPIDIPERPDVDFKTRRLPVGDHQQPQVETPTETTSRPEVSAPPEITTQPPITNQPEITKQPEQVTATGNWLVQVGSFGSLDNANRVGSDLDGLGYAAMLEATGSESDSLVRVKIGPFSSEAEAAQAATRVRDAMPGINPRVVSTHSASAERPVLTGWVVQLGSFSGSENAAQFSANLREQGLTVFIDTLDATEPVVFRVRTGPVSERATAENIRDQIKAELEIPGMVLNLAEQ
jgi:DedD protein